MTIHKGSCLCGDVQVEASGEPLAVAACHCESCRKHTGAAFALLADFDKTNVRFTGAEPRQFESSKRTLRGFCGECGSTISYWGGNLPEMIHIHVGIFDDPSAFAPTANENVDQQAAWLEIKSK